MEKTPIEIQTEWIKLDSFLKFASVCVTGGEAKIRIEQGEILVNGEPCFQRGKKLRDGDVIAVDGQQYVVRRV
ncbi:MAG: RNA-binding S4 domain-containing protein [Butyricicoccus sp.]|jgi:ribosome-associated protein|nr:RNA-binding S4 domain-containing protein [Clostridiales bacterium]